MINIEAGLPQELSGADSFYCQHQHQQDYSNEIVECTNTPTIPNSNKRGSKSDKSNNPFSKFSSFCSSVFSKRTDGSLDYVKREKKIQTEKSEQDWRMARFIAELQAQGRSDEDIQLHLFHLRDMAQFSRPRSNSVGEWFRGMHQAFKDEFAMRRERNLITIHVSDSNPFSAAVSSDYMHNLNLTYENLVRLENVPRGVKSLDKLPVVVYEGQELASCQTSCPICMADFEKGEGLKWLQCSHYFHKECIDKWLGVATTCPVCKGEVHTE